jgi:hypothetical protein
VPVAKTNPRRALLVGLAAIVFAAGLVALVLVANGSGGGSGGGSFDTVRASELIDLQRRDDVPALFPDPVGGRQPIFVWHTGGAIDDGWVAYDAQVDGQPLELDRDDGVLRADDGTEYPFDGTGLPQYEVEVVDGRLNIALVEDDE